MAPRVLLLSVLAASLAGCSAPPAETIEGAAGDVPATEVSTGTGAVETKLEEPFVPDFPSATECVKGELRLFACSLVDGRKVALCSSPEASETSGYVRYALGEGSRVDLAFPKERSAPQERFLRTPVHFFNGNSRHAYSIHTGVERHVLYQLGSARDGRLARGGLMVLGDEGSMVSHSPCTSLDEVEQDALDFPSFEMKPDPLLGESSTLPFGAED